MDIIYVMMLVLITGFFCVLSFLIGTLSNFFNKQVYSLNPITAYKEHKEIKKQQEEYDLTQRQTAVMLDNINKYDGTSTGQNDIPTE